MKSNAEKLANNRWNGNFPRLNDMWIVGLLYKRPRVFIFQIRYDLLEAIPQHLFKDGTSFIPLFHTILCNHL